MSLDQSEIVVRDLGSTNGIRINGQRVEIGRLRPGDELSIAHIRYRYENGDGYEGTMADGAYLDEPSAPAVPVPQLELRAGSDKNAIAAAIRGALPPGFPEHCEIQVIVKMPPQSVNGAESHEECPPS